jgi:ABC-type multidrug transport system fused ATPase/permease subunit
MTLLENVTISSPKKDFKKFEKTIRIAQLRELIKKLPKGINTLIGEKGYRLSGGERQRIGIARAIYTNNPMIILDEATSALDSKTENLIEKGIEQNFENKTLLVIAHRLSTLKNVDKIVVMEKGEIIEEGAYKDLLKKRGEFYKLWRQQKT